MVNHNCEIMTLMRLSGHYRFISTTSRRDKVCPTPPKKSKFQSLRPQPKIVVVGGGMAGLSAAHRLHQVGLSDVTVCEALERPGGKILSYWLGETVGELGAQWIFGGNMANPLLSLACTAGVLKAPFQKKKNPNRGAPVYVTSQGNAISTELSKTGHQIFKQILGQAASIFNMEGTQSFGSLEKFMNTRFDQELAAVPSEYKFDLDKVFGALSNHLRGSMGADLCKVSSRQYGSSLPISGNPIRVPVGMTTVIAPLLEGIPNLKYCKAVQNIKWNGTCPRASVKCIDGEDIPADYVIVALPIGVLRKNLDQMFCPNLPAHKCKAICDLGIGHRNKIIVEYEKPFWAQCEGAINLAWSRSELKERNCWQKGISSIEELPGTKDTLLFTVGGPEAEQIEEICEEKLAEDIAFLFRKFLDDETLPFPTNVVKSKWSSDPFFQGGTIYMNSKSDMNTLCEIGTSCPDEACGRTPVLLFAGEATLPGYFGTLHGARMSGIREAERIISLTEKFNGPPKPGAQVCAARTCPSNVPRKVEHQVCSTDKPCPMAPAVCSDEVQEPCPKVATCPVRKVPCPPKRATCPPKRETCPPPKEEAPCGQSPPPKTENSCKVKRTCSKKDICAGKPKEKEQSCPRKDTCPSKTSNEKQATCPSSEEPCCPPPKRCP